MPFPRFWSLPLTSVTTTGSSPFVLTATVLPPAALNAARDSLVGSDEYLALLTSSHPCGELLLNCRLTNTDLGCVLKLGTVCSPMAHLLQMGLKILHYKHIFRGTIHYGFKMRRRVYLPVHPLFRMQMLDRWQDVEVSVSPNQYLRLHCLLSAPLCGGQCVVELPKVGGRRDCVRSVTQSLIWPFGMPGGCARLRASFVWPATRMPLCPLLS